MEKELMLVGKVFDNKKIITVWNGEEERFETSSITRQLKMIAKDGKNRMTDVVDIEGMFRLIESIPSKKAEPIKLWLAKLEKETGRKIVTETNNTVLKLK